MSKEWFQHNGIAEKLKQGLENVIVGQGLHIIFDGLEDGVATVDVIYNGETCVFYAGKKTRERKPKLVAETVLPVDQAVDTADLPEDPLLFKAITEKPKRKRKQPETETDEHS